jgi:hypothetical protein
MRPLRMSTAVLGSILGLLGLACGGDSNAPEPPPTATRIALNDGNNQSAAAGSAVAISPSVKVTDASAIPVSGVAVTFAVTSGAGSVTGANQTTNVSGVATVESWTLGPTAGTNTMTATAEGLVGSPIIFTAHGETMTVTAVSPVSGAVAGGTAVTITGNNFTNVTSATIGGSELGSRVVVSPTQLTGITSSSGSPGTEDVVVTSSSHGTATCSGCFSYEAPTLEEAETELRSYIENVTQATARRYAATDSRGNVMGGVKIISSADAGGFIGVYSTFSNATGTFYVHLATSSDLMNWNWQRELASEASQPTIKASGDGFVVAWEQGLDNHLKFAYYSTWTDLLNGVASKTFDAPRQLSPSCSEGTPNLYSASSASIDVGFHYHWNCDVDRQARGTTNWKSWSSRPQQQLDAPILAHGVEGNIGDRDGMFNFRGYDFIIIEGQFTKGDFNSWQTFLYDPHTGTADQLSIRTAARSTAFANPTIEEVEIGGEKAVLVTLFLPHETAPGGEAGELIYYRKYGLVDQD